MSEPRRSPERERLLAAVERVRGVAVAHAEASERLRTLAPAVVDALRSSGLFAAAAPRAVGGAESDPLTQLEVFEAMARADTSAGWSLMISALLAALAGGSLPDEGARQVFAGPFPTFAGLQVPSGLARRVSGGYVLEGRWAFGSGVRHARWVFTSAIVPPEGGAPPAGPPEMLSLAVPIEQVAIEDTWDVAGLRGTGSDHYRIEGAFVPEALTCAFPGAPRRRGGALYAIPLLALLAAGHVGFALGVGRRALDEIAAVAPRRIKAWPQLALGSHAAFHMDLGRAEAKLAAARAYAFDALGRMWDRARAGEGLAIEDWAEIRLVQTYVTEVAAEVAGFAYRAGGGSALYAASPLQRCFRDMHAATQHIAATDDAYEFAGRARLGIAELHPLLAPREAAGGERERQGG
ncbi:acyl-CoA dehydrogenase family protein [Sorangium sp. So ce394]|uniref:acyl-CoA dehydrogenase family protein n=1 Tax=Sorangium sp. So ce394 TaxID=3133310 RepID=UPI003F5B9F59